MTELTRREKRKLRKEKKRRAVYDRLRRKEYSESHLNKLEQRKRENGIQQKYPMTRLILIKDFFKSRDLYKAIGLFLGSQISIFLLLIGGNYPEYTTLIGIISLVVGIVLVILSIIEINNRQSKDATRQPVNFKLVFKILFLTLLATSIFPMVVSKLGLSPSVPNLQPNQESFDSTLTIFPIVMVFTTIIVAPFIEELIFRELLPFATGPSYLSFILTSFLFVVVHNPSGLIGWFVYGISSLAFLSARLIDNNIYTGIFVHLLWNIVSLII